jgi:hypothetical protein
MVSVLLLVVSFLSLAAGRADAQTAGDTAAVIVATYPEAAASFADTLVAAMQRELGEAGFGPVSILEGTHEGTEVASLPDIELAGAALAEGTARWAAVVRCSLDNRRVLWRLSVYDALDGALVSSDARAAFAGLSALPLMDESATLVAEAAAALRGRTAPGAPIEYRIRFSSPDDGAAVAFGGGSSSRQLGTIAEGELVAPYAAFESDVAIVATVSKDGYWTHAHTFKPGLADEPVTLPALMPRTRHSLSAGTTAGRLIGLAADYRYHLASDSVFLRAGDQAWFQVAAGGGSRATLHDELRLGLGAYLFLPRPSRFRIAAGSGISGIGSVVRSSTYPSELYFDLSLDAVWISYEWHWPNVAVFVEQRAAYSFGIDAGLLRRGWWQADHAPMLLTAGAMIKW